MLYENHPELQVGQLLVYRSFVSMAIMGALLNFQLYDIMYSSVDASTAPALALQVVMNSFAIFGSFLTTKVFDLTVIVMAFNVSPFLTSLIAYPLLGEKVTLI